MSDGAPDPQAVAQSVAAAQSAEEEASVDPIGELPQSHHPQGSAPASIISGLVGQELVVDNETTETDSALGDDTSSIDASLNSSTTSFRWQRGRRYHAIDGAEYSLPNDDEEKDRLELQHRIWYIILDGGLYLAPLNREDVKHTLDLGCGTGGAHAWAIDFADTHPNSQVLGVDLSPIQPTSVPENCSFLVDNVANDWAFDHKFSYIHTRSIVSGVKDWDRLMKQAWDNLEPGGWLELQEVRSFAVDDGSAAADAPIMTWIRSIEQALAKIGVDLNATSNFKEKLSAAGFVNVNEAVVNAPIGPWARGQKEKSIGKLFQKDIAENLRGISMKMFQGVLGWSEEKYEEFIPKVYEEMYDPKIHMYMPIVIFWAQKPPEGL